jgi:hypothetical protein
MALLLMGHIEKLISGPGGSREGHLREDDGRAIHQKGAGNAAHSEYLLSTREALGSISSTTKSGEGINTDH